MYIQTKPRGYPIRQALPLVKTLLAAWQAWRRQQLKPWLSALTQGNCVSVLVRAYQLTDEEIFLKVARRAIRSFELDIQNGGVSVFVGDDGIFFEEVAVSPAAHILNGYILALFGLY